MSHNINGLPPFVTGISPTSIAVTGSQSFTITGTRFAPNCEVSVPAAIGTVVGIPVITYPTSVTSQMVVTIDVPSLPEDPIDLQLTLFNNGISDTVESKANLLHGLSWTPILIATGSDDRWLEPGILSASSDGAKISSWALTTGSGDALEQATGAQQATYLSSEPNMNNQPVLLFGVLTGDHGGLNGAYTVPHNWKYNAQNEPQTIAFVYRPTAALMDPNNSYYIQMKHDGYSNTSNIVMYDGDDRARLYVAGTDEGYGNYANTGTSTLRMVFFTADGTATPNYTLTEATTGINRSGTGGSAGPPSTSWLGNISSAGAWFGEMVQLGRVISAADKVLLIDYWTVKYGS
jgi:hypothetical protein